MNRELMLSAGVVAGAGLAFLVVFFVLRGIVERIGRLMFRKKDQLVADRLGEHLAALAPPSNVGEAIDRWFERIVGRSELAMSATQAVSYMVLVVVTVAAGLWMWRGRLDLSLSAGLGAATLLLAFFWFMHWRWQRKVQEPLPDTFHLMARSLRSGLTVDQSVKLIGDQGEQPLAAEFKRCHEHLELGLTVPAAF